MPYAAAENPFRVERIHALPYWEPGLDHAALLARAEAMRWRGALVGHHGSGKTTLLLELGRELTARCVATEYLCVGDEARRERSVRPCSDTIYLVDGAERLSAAAWLAFRWRMRSARGLLITAHAPGRLPTLHAGTPSEETLRHLLDALAPPGLEALNERVPALFAQHRGDLRAVFLALFDEYAGRGRGDLK